MRRRRPVLKNDAGMTLIEVLISLVIVFIIFLGISAGGIFVLNENIKNSLRDEAVSVADADLQTVRNMPFPPLDNTYHVFWQIRGLNVDYTVARTVGFLDTQNRQVTVDVGWTRWENDRLKPYSYRAISIVRQR
jgi:prepilin-type N-terminal cleavage/methylation domain-containing protein